MDSNNTIDREEIKNSENVVNTPKNRVFANLLEAIPLLLGVGGYLYGSLVLLAQMLLLLTAVYIFAGWYIFKTDKYQAKDIIFTELSMIIFLTPSISGVLYKIMSWPGGNEMLLIAVYGSFVYVFIALIWYFFHKDNPHKRPLGFKILARIVYFAILFEPLLFGTPFFNFYTNS